jgi:hypothetical protein
MAKSKGIATMNENKLAEWFDKDVDQMLRSNLKPHDEPVPTEYMQVIDLARKLTSTDFSAVSKIKKPLLNELLSTNRKETTMFNVARRAFGLRLTLLVLVSLLLLLIVNPTTVQVAAKNFADFVQTIRVGDYTWIQQNEKPENASPQPGLVSSESVIEYKDGIWILRTSIGNFGGDPLPGHSKTVQSFESIADAQAITPFSIRRPYALPTGYDLQKVIVTPSDWVFLFYGSSSRNLVIAQLPVGKITVNEPTEMTNSVPVGPVTVGQKNTVGVGMLTDKDVETVSVNNQPAAWLEGTGLIWETEGMSFMAGGNGFTKEEVIQIAESLK